ncbi:MAG: hypothetical protein ISR50_08420 [Alphaproteobacteria bacterium]|nr:hypothetical protein [Alphaproteobacteria bacterium]MBL6952643.1 hypothetical protein [Alphaproteobacteria bacterium]
MGATEGRASLPRGVVEGFARSTATRGNLSPSHEAGMHDYLRHFGDEIIAWAPDP